MNIATQYFITSLYHDKAYLLDLEYHTAKKHIIVATLFADNDFPVDSFSRAYDIYMKESYPRVEKTLITRQREANADVQPLLTKNQEIQQAVTEHFKSYFAQTALHKLDVISTNDNMTINIFASTPLSTESYDKKIAARKQILVEIYNKEIRTSSYVSWMQETTAFAGLDLETQDR